MGQFIKIESDLGLRKLHICPKVTKIVSISGHRIDYNGVRANLIFCHLGKQGLACTNRAVTFPRSLKNLFLMNRIDYSNVLLLSEFPKTTLLASRAI